MKVYITPWSMILFVMFLIEGEDTKKRVSNLVDQLGGFGADMSSLRSGVGNMLLQLEGKRCLNGHSPYIS